MIQYNAVCPFTGEKRQEFNMTSGYYKTVDNECDTIIYVTNGINLTNLINKFI